MGSFVKAIIKFFPDFKELHAIEINPRYTIDLKYGILSDCMLNGIERKGKIYIYTADVFKFDFKYILKSVRNENWIIGIIGNPPWVTNSTIGTGTTPNLPLKSNLYKLSGIDAITGKGNFDISESIILNLLRLYGNCAGGISMLLKNSVIKNIVTKQHQLQLKIGDLTQYGINTSKEFNASVEASCLTARLGTSPSETCTINDFYIHTRQHTYGWVGESFVSNVESYKKRAYLDGQSPYQWRSGVKHDCASVLELTAENDGYRNGLAERVDIEDGLIYPLVKSSDVSNFKTTNTRKLILLPQRRVGEEITFLRDNYPKTYKYLSDHIDYFKRRKSRIYNDKGPFSIFGIGDYTFKPFKIIVSSFYKDVRFTLIEPVNNKPVIIDDTCYQLDFSSKEEAQSVLEALMQTETAELIESLVFKDAKRVITKSLLMRLDIGKILNRETIGYNNTSEPYQLQLFD